MKNYLLLLFILLTALAQAKAAEPRDSVIVQFGNKSKIIIYTQNKGDFRKLQKYDVNALLRDLGVKIDSISPNETRLIVTEADGRIYLKDSVRRTERNSDDEKDYVRIGIRGIHVKDGNDEVHVSWDGIHVRDGNEEINIGRADTARSGNRRRNQWSNHGGFYLHLGLDNYTGSGNSNPSANSEFDLRPFGSRYLALGWMRGANLVKGEKASLSLNLGVEFSWYNFMFDGNNVTRKNDSLGRVVFTEFPEKLRKSKLTVAYVNVPIMPTISFRNSGITYIGLGGYAGYRLDSYTKIKRSDGTKDREHGGYYLNNFRYGLRAEIGIRKFPDFFVNYDLNPLFVEGRGPKLNALSFGIRL
ncbi:MAG: PorT family protein [Cytophagaceae bacterium]|nr:PorT family protein [Cytophagaceae bacterium]